MPTVTANSKSRPTKPVGFGLVLHLGDDGSTGPGYRCGGPGQAVAERSAAHVCTSAVLGSCGPVEVGGEPVKVAVRWMLGAIIGGASLTGALAGLGGVAGAAPLHAGGGGIPVLQASLTPSQPTGTAIFAVAPGDVPWSIAGSHVALHSDGMLQVTVARLIDPVLGYNPVPYLAASVYCSASKVGTTMTVPFSHAGNAHLRARVALPSTCSAPAVLVNPALNATAPANLYIAFTGTGT